ncbi:MAG: hypothetical protein JWP78_2806 [Mucilaginibacter sp.]|nr:hypothetical protein [Mucilaginibacter sp.]
MNPFLLLMNAAWCVSMKPISRQFKQILLTTMFVLYTVTSISQQAKQKALFVKQAIAKRASQQLIDFYRLTTDAGVVFIFPEGFKETRVLNNENFPLDYAIEIPGHEFELWFQVKSQKENWANYERFKNDPTKAVACPDSLYIQLGQAEAKALTGDEPYFTRNISGDVLARYNADAGKSYLLNLADRRETKHYKYALVLSLQKNRSGTVLMVCFTNEKSPEFFKNVNRMCRYIKFKS